MVLTLEDRVQEVTQSDQFSLHYRLQLGVHRRLVNTSLSLEFIPRLRHFHRDLYLTPGIVLDVERLYILGNFVKNRVTDLKQLEVEVVMEEAVILEGVVAEVMVFTKTVGLTDKWELLQRS